MLYMAVTPIKARINGATTFKTDEGIYSDSVLVTFEDDGGKIIREFESPFLNEENIRMWRKLVLYVVLNEQIPTDNDQIFDFDKYKSVLSGRDVYIAYDGNYNAVYAIGVNPNNMFFPDEYGLWDEPE